MSGHRGGSPAHQKLIVSNLATALFEHGRITTTEARARVLRPIAEKLITKAKRGDLHNRRLVLATIRDKGVVHALFEDIAPRYAERPGGYTRITKIGPRKGDNAPMAVIELVTEDYTPQARSTQRATPAAEADTADAGTEATESTESTEASETPATEESGVEAAPGSDDPATQAAEEDAPAQESTEAAVEDESADESK